jgi:DNA-binding CsgD family transcriptional regulator
VNALTLIEAIYDYLDRAPTAVVLLDEQRRVIYANARAAGLQQRRDGIRLSQAGLGLSRTPDHAKLQVLIERALVSRSIPGSMSAGRAPGKRAYVLFVHPLPQRRQLPGTVRPAVCVVIADPDATRGVRSGELRTIFGLTDAEARLVARLASGNDLRSTARELGVTYGTARARLAEIFQKTDTRRQGELINLVLTTLELR